MEFPHFFVVPMVAMGVAFVAGVSAYLLAARASRRRPPVEPRPGCFHCGAPPDHACEICGGRFCAEHGGKRLSWSSHDGDGGHSLAYRLVCDCCTPSRLQLRASFALALVFAAGVLTAIIYGWATFPGGFPLPAR